MGINNILTSVSLVTLKKLNRRKLYGFYRLLQDTGPE